MNLKLVRIDLKRRSELDWLHRFIREHHSSPKQVLPAREDLKNPSYRFFKAIALEPRKHQGEVIGISSYEIRTRFLVETQKTIVDSAFRGLGWGRILSDAIEKQVRKDGYKKIRTTIYVDNLPMIAIKLSQGFRIEGFHPDHDAPGLDEYSLGKILS
jgi:ribosomal protein S18 acetylase RimI-like enzyme